jgi:hypothetical protein
MIPFNGIITLRLDLNIENLCPIVLTKPRYYSVGGITIEVRSDLPITDKTFAPALRQFEVTRPGKDIARVRLHFSLPAARDIPQGTEVYRKTPWSIARTRTGWVYTGIAKIGLKQSHLIAVFNHGHTSGDIYVPGDRLFRAGNLGALTLFPTDQILLARLLADCGGALLHSAGVILKRKGLLFLGHSSAGKSTICGMLAQRASILCDDRIIVRGAARGFQLYGTWSHGTFPQVSAGHAPLKALFFLRQSRRNRITPAGDRAQILKRLLPLVVKPLVTADWWERTLDTLESLAARVPAYELEFDKSGEIVKTLAAMVSGGDGAREAGIR